MVKLALTITLFNFFFPYKGRFFFLNLPILALIESLQLPDKLL
jgi:hypothetical protein